jgi:tyrosine-protein phosphatase SIW14
MQTRRLGFLNVPAAALALALGLATSAAAAPGSAHASRSDVVASAVRIDNFGQVSTVLYRGSQPHSRDYADLKSLGVRTIVNLTGDDGDPNERSMAEAAGIAYVNIPMSMHVAPTPAQIAQFLALVNDPASQPVYVHCVGGRHRTGVMTATYRMTDQGWSADKAFKEMKQYNFGPSFLHPEFKDFVYNYRPAVVAENAAATPAAAREGSRSSVK